MAWFRVLLLSSAFIASVQSFPTTTRNNEKESTAEIETKKTTEPVPEYMEHPQTISERQIKPEDESTLVEFGFGITKDGLTIQKDSRDNEKESTAEIETKKTAEPILEYMDYSQRIPERGIKAEDESTLVELGFGITKDGLTIQKDSRDNEKESTAEIETKKTAEPILEYIYYPQRIPERQIKPEDESTLVELGFEITKDGLTIQKDSRDNEKESTAKIETKKTAEPILEHMDYPQRIPERQIKPEEESPAVELGFESTKDGLTIQKGSRDNEKESTAETEKRETTESTLEYTEEPQIVSERQTVVELGFESPKDGLNIQKGSRDNEKESTAETEKRKTTEPTLEYTEEPQTVSERQTKSEEESVEVEFVYQNPNDGQTIQKGSMREEYFLSNLSPLVKDGEELQSSLENEIDTYGKVNIYKLLNITSVDTKNVDLLPEAQIKSDEWLFNPQEQSAITGGLPKYLSDVFPPINPFPKPISGNSEYYMTSSEEDKIWRQDPPQRSGPMLYPHSIFSREYDIPYYRH